MANNYNTTLQTNNTDLQAILNTINELPEAGSGGIDTSDATATADKIFLNESAYVNNEKVVGTFTIDEELTTQDSLVTQIENILATKAAPSGIDTSDATATADTILDGETAYVDGEKITGNIKTKTESDLTTIGAAVIVPAGHYASDVSKSVNTTEQAVPTISVNDSGLITASTTQTPGYVTGGPMSATKQLTTQAAKTITPSKSSQTAVAKNVYTTGVVTVGAIPDEYTETSDATATADKILDGETAYVDGEKITGNIKTKTSSDLTASGATVNVPAGYYASGVSKSVNTTTQATPSITVSANGLITATTTQTEGYVSAGNKSSTKQLTTETWVFTMENNTTVEKVVIIND
jgi:hypothetical protein